MFEMNRICQTGLCPYQRGIEHGDADMRVRRQKMTKPNSNKRLAWVQ